MNKLYFPLILFVCLALALPAVASEVTGSLSTGLASSNVEGTLITAPSASPSSGTYASMQFVVLSAVGSSGIRYTTDGTTPTCSIGVPYHLPLPVSQSLTVKAIACYPNSVSSSVSTFSYTGTLSVTPSDMPNLLSSGIFIPTGTTLSASNLTATQQVRINVANDGGTSTVILSENTVISATDGSNFDANTLSAGTVSGTSLAGLGSGVVVDGALHWGIADRGLTFNPAVSLSIFVGVSHNGETLNIQRSISGSGDWSNDGISSATCVVADGLCSFTATRASYYVATSISSTPTPTPTPTPAPSSGGSGGGGGGYYSTPTPSTTPLSAAAQKVDTNKDGKVNILDFNSLMINWGSTTAGNVTDFNSDGKVDILDFNQLMINWTS